MTELKGVLFDKDGTLIDFTSTWRGMTEDILAELSGGDEALAAALGRTVGFDVTTGLFLPGSPVVAGSVDLIADMMAPLLPRMTAADIENFVNRRVLAADHDTLAPAPALRPTLERLRGMGLRLGVGTHDAEAPARAHVAALGVADLFDFIAGYDSGHGHKPGPGMPRAFAAHIGAEAAEVVMVGDSLHDLGAGRAAGCAHCVAVLTGVATEAELAPEADIVLPSIADLPDFLADRRNPA